MDNKDQILANFQACTDITDYGEAFSILESSNWILEDAVNTALAFQDIPGVSAMAVTGHRIPHEPLGDLDETGHGGRSLPDSPLPRTVFPDSRLRQEIFDVTRFIHTLTAEFDDKTVTVSVEDTLTIGEVKTRIAENAGLSQTPLTFYFTEPEIQCEDSDQLRDLDLPTCVRVRVLSCETPQIESMSISDDGGNFPAEDMALFYQFNIRVEHVTNVRTELNERYEGSITVGEVKQDISSKTGIPLHCQIWEGWPSQAEDDSVLAACSLTRPIQRLRLQCVPSEDTPAQSVRTIRSTPSLQNHRSTNSNDRLTGATGTAGSDDDMESDNFDFDDSFEPPRQQNPRRGPLMPKGVSDPRESTAIFNREFVQRYSASASHPIFFEGGLREAIQESLHCSPHERQPLAVYLHHEDSLITNIFCSNVLCSEVISNYLNANFLCWGWDLTELENKQRLQTQCLEVLGNSTLSSASNATTRREVTTMIRNFTSDDLPQIMFFSKVRGALEIMSSVRASNSPEEFLGTLINYQQIFEDHKQQDVREAGERYEREEMKRLQDEAYEQSLANDRIKEDQRRREEQAKEDLIKDEERKKQQLEEDKQSAAEGLPEEPSEDSNDSVAILRFRCPDGEMLQRRFLATNKFRILLKFLLTKGYNVEEFKILTTFPRKDISQENRNKTLEELKLYPQETLILESRS